MFETVKYARLAEHELARMVVSQHAFLSLSDVSKGINDLQDIQTKLNDMRDIMNQHNLFSPGDIVGWKFLFWTFMFEVNQWETCSGLYSVNTMKRHKLPFSIRAKNLRALDPRDIARLK